MKASHASRPTSVLLLAALLVTRSAVSQTIPPDGPNYRLNQVTAGTQTEVALATVNTAGEAVAVWAGPDGLNAAQPLDLVFGLAGGLVSCYFNDPPTLQLQCHPSPPPLPPPHPIQSIAVGDLDGDFNQDVLISEGDLQLAACFFDYLHDDFDCIPFVISGTVTTIHEIHAIELADLDLDGILDFVAATDAASQVCLGQDLSPYVCSEIRPLEHVHDSRDVALGDWNGDNNPDALFANYGEANTLCLGNGSGGFNQCFPIDADSSDSTAVARGDLNGDGIPDAVFANRLQPQVVCIGSGSGPQYFDCQTLLLGETAAAADVAIADLDHVPPFDLIFANDGQPNRVCLGHGPPAWNDCFNVDNDSRPTKAVTAGDIDGNGHTDLVFANFNMASEICLNDGTPSFACQDINYNLTPGANDVVLTDYFSTGSGVLKRDLDANGNPQGTEVLVNQQEVFQQRRPAIASDRLGRFVVVWQSGRFFNFPPDAEPEIHARFYNAAGSPNDEVFVSEAGAGLGAERPSVAMDASGAAIVVWQELTGSGAQTKVMGRRLDTSGSPLGPPFEIGGTGRRDAGPKVAKNATTGEFLVVWKTVGGTLADPEILARLFDGDANPLGAPFEVSSTEEDILSRHPDVAIDGQGHFLVAWDDSPLSGNGDVNARWFDASGSPLGPQFLVNTTLTGVQSWPRVAVDRPTGDFLVTWQDEETQADSGIRARWFAADFEQPGITPAEDFVVDESGSGREHRPAMTVQLDGDFLVAWEGASSGDDPDILAQRYAAPVRLTINDISILEGPLPPLGSESPESPDAFALFTVQASKPHPLFGAGAQIHVDFHTIDNTATYLGDYEFTQGSLTFVDGVPLALPVLVPIIDDGVFEGDESFFVSLIDAENAVVARPKGLARIIDNDPPGSLSIGDVEEFEGNSGTHNFVFTVSLGPVQEADALVSFATRDCPGLGDNGSAQAGSDYEQTSGVLGFPAGTTTAFVAVSVLGDAINEPDEDFCVDLYDPFNATLLNTPGRGTILTEPGEGCIPPIEVSPTVVQVPVEGAAGLQVQVTDDAPCGWSVGPLEISVNWIQNVQPPPGIPQTGSGTVSFDVMANPYEGQRSTEITIANQAVTVEQDGTGCPFTITPTSQAFPATGGAGEVTVGNIGDLCAWTVETTVSWIHLGSSGGVAAGVLTYTVDPNPPGEPERATHLSIVTSGHSEDFEIHQDGDFFDHFDNEELDDDWNYLPDPSAWTEHATFMTGNASGAGESAQAIADPAFRGCIECTIEAAVEISLFSVGDLTLFGWYYDDDNYVALTMNEFWNTWTLTERVGGVDANISTLNQSILVGVVYEVAMGYDGDTVSASVNGQPIAAITPAATPDGTVGLRVDETLGAIDRIRVITFTESVRVFQDDFESGDSSGWDLTVP